MAVATQLTRSTPEAEGIASAAILDFIDAVEQHTHPLDAIQGFILLRHGNVAAEGWWAPYGPEVPHSMFSLSKSFTSTGIGLAIAEGLLTVDDLVLGFFPDEAPANPDANLQAMRVRHLLAMNTGHHEDTTGRVFRGEDDNWPRTFLSLPVEHEPGSWFVYNTGATYMLSAIITKLTGQPLLDYLRPRLFAPLGIEDPDPTWETDPHGINIGGSGLHIRTEDIARFGQLYLQKGVWNGTRILSEAWVEEATSAHSDNSNTQTNPDWTVGYGYQFWRCRPGGYRGDGAFGQFCIVMPEQDAVLAITSGVRDMQAVLDKVWTHLLPAMQPEALPGNGEAQAQLTERLASLSLPLPSGATTSPQAATWSGKTYEMDENGLHIDRIAFTFGADRATVVARTGEGEHSIAIGSGSWARGTTNLRGKEGEPIAATGAWIADDTFELRACYDDSESGVVMRFRFADTGLTVEAEPNVGWGSTGAITFAGREVPT